MDEGGIPGVCGGIGSGKGVLQVVRNFWPSLEMGTEDAETLLEFRADTANPGWRNIADLLGVEPLIELPAK